MAHYYDELIEHHEIKIKEMEEELAKIDTNNEYVRGRLLNIKLEVYQCSLLDMLLTRKIECILQNKS